MLNLSLDLVLQFVNRKYHSPDTILTEHCQRLVTWLTPVSLDYLIVQSYRSVGIGKEMNV